jgi:hypothetical protein
MTKLRLVSDGAERRVRSTAREIVFAIALSAAAALSVMLTTTQRPNAETASNESEQTNQNRQ